MLLGLALSGNPDATFGWSDAPEFTGCSGWGPDFPEDNEDMDREEESEEAVTLEEEEVAAILLMLSRSGKFNVTDEVKDVSDTDDDECVTDDSNKPYYNPNYHYYEENTLSHPDSEPEEQSLDVTINVLDPDFAPDYSTYIAPCNHPIPVSHMLEQPTVCTLNAVKAFNCLRLSQPSNDAHSPTRIDNTWFSEEVGHLTRGGRHFKPAFLEGDCLGKTPEEEMERNNGRGKEEEEDDVVLK